MISPDFRNSENPNLLDAYRVFITQNHGKSHLHWYFDRRRAMERLRARVHSYQPSKKRDDSSNGSQIRSWLTPQVQGSLPRVSKSFLTLSETTRCKLCWTSTSHMAPRRTKSMSHTRGTIHSLSRRKCQCNQLSTLCPPSSTMVLPVLEL